MLGRWTIGVLVLGLGLSSVALADREVDSSPGPTRSRSTPNIDAKDALSLQTKIINEYNAQGCLNISKLATAVQQDRLPPTAIAVVAFCSESDVAGDSLFNLAMAKEPSSDIIHALYAQFLWKKNPERSNELWRKTILLSRGPVLSSVAKSYLQGGADPKARILVEDRTMTYLNAQVGFGYETNPSLINEGTDVRNPSAFLSAQTAFGLQHRLGGVTLSGNYELSYRHFLSNRSADYLENDLELPVVVRAGTNEDLQIRPFGSYVLLGNLSYYLLGGLSVAGLAFRGQYRQIVQAQVYKDHYVSRLLQPQQGTHFRFEYGWEFYPEDWFLRLRGFIEHVQAGRQIDTTRGLNIPFSHNNIGGQAFAEYNIRWAQLSLSAQLVYRLDDNETAFRRQTGALEAVRKRRQDIQLLLQPGAAFPAFTDTHILVLYRFIRRFSNFGASDNQDHNLVDHQIFVGARIAFGTP